MRLLIIDDHDAVREALEVQLRTAASVDIVGCTGCWKAGLQEALRLQPDVVLLETKRTDGQGLEALRCLTEQCPHVSIVVLTSYPDPEEQRKVHRMGITHYVLKDIDTPQLVHKIQTAVRPHALI